MTTAEQTNQTESILIDRFQAVKVLGGISIPTLNRLVRSGDLPVVRIGRRVFFTHDILTDWVKTHSKVKSSTKK